MNITHIVLDKVSSSPVDRTMKSQTELRKDLLPCLYIFQFLGNQFFTLLELKKAPRKWPTLKFCVYFAAMLIFISVMHLTSLLYVYRGNSEDSVSSVINNIKDVGELLILFGTSVAMLVTFFLTTSCQEGIFVNLESIAELFKGRLERKLCFKSFRAHFLIRLTISMIIFIVVLCWNYYVIYKVTQEVNNQAMHSVVSLLMVMSMIILFSFYADLINHNLEMLAEKLESLAPGQLNHASLAVITVSNFDSHIYDQLSAIKSIHLHLFEISNLVNECMGRQILLFVIAASIKITLGGYSTFLAISKSQVNDTTFIEIFASVFFLLILFYLIYYAEKPVNAVSY